MEVHTVLFFQYPQLYAVDDGDGCMFFFRMHPAVSVAASWRHTHSTIDLKGHTYHEKYNYRTGREEAHDTSSADYRC